MPRIKVWRLAIFAVAAGAFAGCSNPLTEQDILDRLARSGVPSSDDNAAQGSPVAAGPGTGIPERGIVLADLLRRADRANPELRAARSAVGVAAGRAWQAGLYPNPSARVESGEVGLEGGSANTVVGITQPIVVGGRLRAAVAAADAAEAARLADVERVRREVFGRVAELHARVLELAAQLRLIDELLGIGERTLAIAETRFGARAVSEPDVIRPRVEVYQLRADRQRVARELETAERQLGLTLSTEPVAAERLAGSVSTDPPALDEEPLRFAVETDHPALVAAEREIEAAEAALRRIRAERVPDLDISAGVGHSEEGDQGIVELGVGAEFPLWDRRQGDIMAARFEVMQRRQTRAARRNELLAQLAEQIGAYNAARDELLIMRDSVVPDARRAFDQIDESYRAGRASFIDLLDTQRTLMQSRRTLIELAGGASVAKARIAAIAGMDLLAPTDGQEDEGVHEPQREAPNGAEVIE